jgi:hypothetical protein
MATVSRDRFRAALDALSRDAFAAFVAAAYAARGHETSVEVDATRVRVDDRVLAVHTGRGWRRASVPDDADAVVTSGTGRPRGTPEGVAVIDADALRDLALFGVDAAARDALFERLDCEPTRVEDGGGRPVRRVARLAVAVLALALIAAGALGGLPADDRAPSAAFDTETVAPATTVTAFEGEAVTTTTTTIRVDGYPPGLNASGVTDPAALAATFAREISGEPYRLHLVYREHTGLSPTGSVEQTVRVRAPGEYLVERSVNGFGMGTAYPDAGPEAYADGRVRYERVMTGETNYTVTRVDTTGDVGRYAEFVATYVRGVLSGRSTAIVGTFVEDGVRHYQVWVRGGREGSRLGGVSATVVVDARGVVREIEERFVIDEASDVSGSVRFRYSTRGTSIERPWWLTNGTRVGTAPS